MNVILLDRQVIWRQLLPFTYTRPVSHIRIGISTLAEKWKDFLGQEVSCASEDYLADRFPVSFASINLIVNSGLLPSAELTQAIQSLKEGEVLVKGELMLAAKCTTDQASLLRQDEFSGLKQVDYRGTYDAIDHPWDIFSKNGKVLRDDYSRTTAGRLSNPISDPHTVVYNADNIFLEDGAQTKACILNAENGPIYLGKDAKVDEGAMIRGPFALGEGSIVNMGAKMRGDITIGPYCKVGGEISNSILFGYSNKGHDGFLGNSVLGEWCNLGADTNSSNLKNNYTQVKAWSYVKGSFVNTGLQFCGLMMGDHSKCGINTMFNTATVVGVSANIFGDGFPRTFIPSFSWGGANGFTTFQLSKSLEVARAMMHRRGLELSKAEEDILREVMVKTATYRTWEQP